MSKRTTAEIMAEKESHVRTLKRKLKIETQPRVKEAVFIARALRKWNEGCMDATLRDLAEKTAAHLDALADGDS